jgi:hypothetical protein
MRQGVIAVSCRTVELSKETRMSSPTIKPRTSTVVIHQGDYLDEIRHLEDQIAAAQAAESGPRTLDEIPASQALIERHDALVAEAEAEAITVKVRNLGRRTYHDLKVKHPPRDDKPGDANLGCNEDTFFDELVPLSLVAPSFDTTTDLERFLEDLAPIDWERVKLAAFRVNEVATADPKPFPASRLTRENDAT